MSAKANTPKVQAVLDRFTQIGIIPVVVLNDAKDAEPLGKALMEGGLPAAEVTFRTDAAEESIRIMAEKFPDMLVGAGTVLSVDEMIGAMNLGLDHVKFFPAELNGGLKKIKAITAALVNLKIMPTGGINAENVVDYLKNDHIFCAGGSWMVKGDLIKAGKFDEIKAKVAEAAEIVRKVRAGEI